MIGIINYGIGNVFAFKNVYDRLGVDSVIVNSPDQLLLCNKLILPGVGAFDAAISILKSTSYFSLLEDRVLRDKVPLLGVCIGMHLLASSSDEGSLPGLGWIPGVVNKLPLNSSSQYVLPHIGWNSVHQIRPSPLIQDLDSSYFYFLHSYHFNPDSQDASFLSFNLDSPFICGVSMGNIFGVQFHPEKSHRAGTKLLLNFSRL